jgi:anthranilate phosphoribosyltransferase
VYAVLTDLTEKLILSEALTAEEVQGAIQDLLAPEVDVVSKANFLVALAQKGETPGEIAAFTRGLRAHAVEPPLHPETRSGDILDVCGTGGDRLHTFNISTTVALVAASAGVTVAKHGNRAITSQAGSADVLEALGIPVKLTPSAAAQSLREHHFAFFFAPDYHPAFKHIGPARKLCAERGQRTIFNFLGPLLNPARPTVQLVGVPRPELCHPIALVLQELGVRRAMVVSGNVGGQAAGLESVSRVDEKSALYLDELSTLGNTTIAEFYHDKGLNQSVFSPNDLELSPCGLSDLRGGDRIANAGIVERLLQGKERGPKRDAVLLNAAAALFVAGRATSFAEGWKLAADLIDSGKASQKLEDLRHL